MNELILYTSQDGLTRLQLRAEGETIWLTQLEIAELFQTTKQNVSLHVINVFEEGELTPEATVKESLRVQLEGVREVKRTITYYNLDLILAIGYRIRSPRGTQFRQWATTNLREYLVKGFVMDDERLKNPGGWDYFDELLERIREIRASEEREVSSASLHTVLVGGHPDTRHPTPDTQPRCCTYVHIKLSNCL